MQPDGAPGRTSPRSSTDESERTVPTVSSRARRLTTSIALATTITGAFTLPTAARAAPRPDRAAVTTGWVVGVAVDRAGKPVAGALVNVLSPTEVPEVGIVDDETDRRTTTARDGSFRVRQSAEGYLVQVCVPDHDVPTTCRETSRGADFAITYVGGSGTTDSWVLQQSLLPATTTTNDVGTVTVQPVARLVGTVRGAAAGQEVRLMRLNDTVAFRTWTDRDGRYSLAGLVPGQYYVASGGAGTLPWSSAPVRLVADTTTRVDGSLTRGAVLRGRLVARSGKVARTEVVVERRGHGFVASSVVDRRGRFEVSGLVPGRYTVRVPGPGGTWEPRTTGVRITGADQVVRPVVRLRRGAQVVVDLREAGRPAANVIAEVRDRHGRPAYTGASDDRGRLTVGGLPAGRWTIVAAGRKKFGARTVTVRTSDTVRARALTLDRAFLTLRGRTAPRAVVEATTGDFCPPDGTHSYGAFQDIVQADAQGRYRFDRLVPGRYMLGADGWPRVHAPRCWSGVRIGADQRRDLPLQRGVAAAGRLVYAGTSQPVITPLSYELFHRPGLSTNPTEEHPARARTVGATGRFEIRRITPGAVVTGRLAREAGEGINDESFFVTFPFQDGTPYWLETSDRRLVLPTTGTVALGDVPVEVLGR